MRNKKYEGQWKFNWKVQTGNSREGTYFPYRLETAAHAINVCNIFHL